MYEFKSNFSQKITRKGNFRNFYGTFYKLDIPRQVMAA